MRRGMISYILFKLYVKKLHLYLRTAREQKYSRWLDSLYNILNRNWKALNSLMAKNKTKISLQKLIVDGFSTYDTTKVRDNLCNSFIYHPRNIHRTILISISNHFDRIECITVMPRKTILQSLLCI